MLPSDPTDCTVGEGDFHVGAAAATSGLLDGAEGMLLTSEVLLWLSVTLVKLQEEEKLSIPPQGLLNLLLR